MLVLLIALAMSPAPTEVVDASASGFTSRNTVHVSAAPDAVYEALVNEIHEWWDAAHTYTADSTNMSLDAEAGGCLCESLPSGGSVQHMEVVYADPGKTLRLRGGLGPLQGMGVTGAMTFELQASDDGTQITLSYAVGGYTPGEGGLAGLAGPVDGVVGGQLAHLAQYVDPTDAP
jgi:uncharacterized protein YndB with AHSA1/START domain